MPLYRIPITPQTPFSSPIKGDTLFGYICWEYKNAYGENALTHMLKNYHAQPAFVVSDAVPMGCIPRPHIPLHMMGLTADTPDIKAKKKIPYMPNSVLHHPIKHWFDIDSTEKSYITPITRTHNSINRQTHTTGTADDGGKFAPYNTDLVYLGKSKDKDSWHIYIVIPDTAMVNIDVIHGLLKTIGQFGYGAGKTRGLGKFAVSEYTEHNFANTGDAFLTLAPHKPNPDYGIIEKCFYTPFTRFGKVGDVGVYGGNPFKSPILMANTGAVITPKTYMADSLYIGSAVGGMDDGKGSLSATIPNMVHQGYSPIIPIMTQGDDT